MTKAGPVPNKDQLPRADLGSVAAAAVEDGLLVEYPARRQGHLVGSRILQRKMHDNRNKTLNVKLLMPTLPKSIVISVLFA